MLDFYSQRLGWFYLTLTFWKLSILSRLVDKTLSIAHSGRETPPESNLSTAKILSEIEKTRCPQDVPVSFPWQLRKPAQISN